MEEVARRMWLLPLSADTQLCKPGEISTSSHKEAGMHSAQQHPYALSILECFDNGRGKNVCSSPPVDLGSRKRWA